MQSPFSFNLLLYIPWMIWMTICRYFTFLPHVCKFFILLKITALLHYIKTGYNFLINYYQFLAIQLYRKTFVIFNILDAEIQFLRSKRTYNDITLLQYNIQGIHLLCINWEVAQVAYKIFHVFQRDKPLPIRIQHTKPSDKTAFFKAEIPLLKLTFLFFRFTCPLEAN